MNIIELGTVLGFTLGVFRMIGMDFIGRKFEYPSITTFFEGIFIIVVTWIIMLYVMGDFSDVKEIERNQGEPTSVD